MTPLLFLLQLCHCQLWKDAYIGKKPPESGYMWMDSELTVDPRNKILEFWRILQIISIFFRGKPIKMLAIAKKGLRNKAENNLGSLLYLIPYAFLISLSQEECSGTRKDSRANGGGQRWLNKLGLFSLEKTWQNPERHWLKPIRIDCVLFVPVGELKWMEWGSNQTKGSGRLLMQ